VATPLATMPRSLRKTSQFGSHKCPIKNPAIAGFFIGHLVLAEPDYLRRDFERSERSKKMLRLGKNQMLILAPAYENFL